MKEHELAYAAGLIDGEGTVAITRKRKSSPWRTPVVSFPNTSEALIRWFSGQFGGCVVCKRVYQPQHSRSWECRVCDNAAIELLERLLPYLRHPAKIWRATLLIERYHAVTPRNGKYSAAAAVAKREFELAFFHPESS